MQDEFKAMPLPRNEATRRQHRRQSWLQIGLPLLIGIIVIVAPVVWIVAGGHGEVGSLAQIATMLLAMIGIVGGVLLLVLSLVMIYALARLMQWIPPQAFRLQQLIRQADERIEQAADLAARPVIALDSWGKAAQRIFTRRR